MIDEDIIIRAVVLERLVLQNLQRVVAYAQHDEDEFMRRVMENKIALYRGQSRSRPSALWTSRNDGLTKWTP